MQHPLVNYTRSGTSMKQKFFARLSERFGGTEALNPWLHKYWSLKKDRQSTGQQPETASQMHPYSYVEYIAAWPRSNDHPRVASEALNKRRCLLSSLLERFTERCALNTID